MTAGEEDEGRVRKLFGRGRKWFRAAKETLTEKASEFGEAEEIWRAFEEESNHIELILRDESLEAYSALVEQVEGTADWLESMDPRKPTEYWEKPVVEWSVYSTATSWSYFAPTSYPTARPRQSESLYTRLAERRHDRETVARQLLKLAPRLRSQFEQAWQTWHSATKERRKPAMYEMRDVLLDTVVHLSKPGGKFPGQTAESRKKRVEWIADNLVSDPSTRQLLRRRADRYPDLVGYKGLSKAHEPRLREAEANALLLEAQEFLLVLLSSLDWNLVKARGLCR